MKVKDIKVDNMFFTEKNGHKLLCTITECHNSVLPGVLNFIAKLDDGKTLISLCGLPDNDYLHFDCNRKPASLTSPLPLFCILNLRPSQKSESVVWNKDIPRISKILFSILIFIIFNNVIKLENGANIDIVFDVAS